MNEETCLQPIDAIKLFVDALSYENSSGGAESSAEHFSRGVQQHVGKYVGKSISPNVVIHTLLDDLCVAIQLAKLPYESKNDAVDHYVIAFRQLFSEMEFLSVKPDK